MDYYQIGQQIRQLRKAQGLSQEQLAEKVGISVTHMSHIETGNTKLSLPVLVAIAQALDVRTDRILFATQQKPAIAAELQSLLDACTPQQAQVLLDVAKSVKIAMDKHLPE